MTTASALAIALEQRVLGLRRSRDEAWRCSPAVRRMDVGGHRIRLLDTEAVAPAVVLACDAPVFVEHYLPLVERIGPARRVLVLEMPGFGFSRPARGYGFGLDAQVDVLRAVLDARAIRAATLAFTCVNALVALRFAAVHPERVERLVLAQAPGIGHFQEWARRIDPRLLGVRLLHTPLVGQAATLVAPAAIARAWFRAASADADLGRALGESSAAVIRAGGTFALASLMQALRAARDVFPALLPPPSCPTTVVWGARDRTHRHTPKDLALVGGRGSVELWADAGHCLDVEQPERFAALLLRA